MFAHVGKKVEAWSRLRKGQEAEGSGNHNQRRWLGEEGWQGVILEKLQEGRLVHTFIYLFVQHVS